jgi:hypothetical protein
MFTIRWLTNLAGERLTPAGIIDVARPHTPVIDPDEKSGLSCKNLFQLFHKLL